MASITTCLTELPVVSINNLKGLYQRVSAVGDGDHSSLDITGFGPNVEPQA